jgi:Ni/Co efflux regulator RcnB
MKTSLLPALSASAVLAAVLIAGVDVRPAAAEISFGMATLPVQMRGLGLIQYGAQNPPPGYERGYEERDRDRDRGDRDRDRDSRGPHRWRAGEVLPPEFAGRVVGDWEDRGLSRPPGGHEWVRVGSQFILVRDRDHMIARTLNFD